MSSILIGSEEQNYVLLYVMRFLDRGVAMLPLFERYLKPGGDFMRLSRPCVAVTSPEGDTYTFPITGEVRRTAETLGYDIMEIDWGRHIGGDGWTHKVILEET